MHRVTDVEVDETLALRVGVCAERGAHEADCHRGGDGGGGAHGSREGGTVCEHEGVDSNGGFQVGDGGAEVRWGERFEAKLRGVVSREGIELVGVAACYQNPPILQE